MLVCSFCEAVWIEPGTDICGHYKSSGFNPVNTELLCNRSFSHGNHAIIVFVQNRPEAYNSCWRCTGDVEQYLQEEQWHLQSKIRCA